jgi:Putative metal-binding motif
MSLGRSPLTALATALLALGCGPATSRRAGDPPPDGGFVFADDPTRDRDGDGVSPAQGDCRDDDPTVHPGAPEPAVCDGKDHDCNGTANDLCDADQDGYAILAGGELQGGDCNDTDPLVNPGAVEVPGDGVDNNCDGKTDEPVPPCDGSQNKADPIALAGQIGLCPPWVESAKIVGSPDPRAIAIKTKFGLGYKPKQGNTLLMLSTGIAADKSDPSFVKPQSGTSFKNDAPNPAPEPNNNACYLGPDEQEVHDYVELWLKLKVPTNAKSFTFNFTFVSAEYPEFVGTQFNDKFLVLLDSKSYQGNISFDGKKNPITVNAGFFDVCQSATVCNGKLKNLCGKPVSELDGTGYEDPDFSLQPIGGGTGWLTTTSPVTPGEEATLRFILFDEGDHIYDSSVIIDNFEWQADPAMDPNTIG